MQKYKLLSSLAFLMAFTTNAVALEISKNFTELGALNGPLKLTTWQSAYTVKVPVSARESVYGALVHLETTNSTALIKSRSELSVRVNNQIMGQYPLDPLNTKGARDILIPGEMLKVGYNDVTIGVVQHYTYDCEDPASPELWTEIDPKHSTVTLGIDGEVPNVTPKLSQLDTAFDPKGWLPKKLAVVMGTKTTSESNLKAMSLAIQGLALRMGYRPLDVVIYKQDSALPPADNQNADASFPGINPAVFDNKDVLLIGTASDLGFFKINEQANAQTLIRDADSYVRIASANQGKSVVLIVSGSTVDGLIKASKSLADLSFKYSDNDINLIKDTPSLKGAYVAKIKEDEFFSNFGYTTTYSRGMKLQPIAFEFRAPPDFSARSGDKLKLMLHFAYGAGLRKDSAMSIFLNGSPANSIPLNTEKGGEFSDYTVELPAQFVKPGRNKIVFEPVFLAHKDRCDMLRDEHWLLTVYEDSTLQLPRDTSPIMVPDLQRTAQGVWPFTSKLQFQLQDGSDDLKIAALKLNALLAQKNQGPMDVDYKLTDFATKTAVFDSGPVLVMGSLEKGDDIRGFMPNFKGGWGAAGSDMIVSQSLINKQVITSFIGGSDTVTAKGIYALNEKGLWDGLEGGSSIVNTSDFTLLNQPAPKKQAISTTEKWLIKYDLHDQSKLMWVLQGALVVFSIALVKVMRMRAKRRQNDQAFQETVPE